MGNGDNGPRLIGRKEAAAHLGIESWGRRGGQTRAVFCGMNCRLGHFG